VDKLSAFFDCVHQDPVICKVKLIAEPWDVGTGGYQVGNFPVLWTEWNGKFRDVVRGFWNGKGVSVGELSTRMAGSSDLYDREGRAPHASINFVTCHDGFSLHDLVSYNDKHNDLNLEDNKDGNNDNLSWNHGAEGPTDDAAVNEFRLRQKCNIAATLFLSIGVPMISGGDEFSHTKGGNNNTYCQDNVLSYYNWDLSDPLKEQFLSFLQKMIRIRKKNPVLQRRKFLRGHLEGPYHLQDVTWLHSDGRPFSEEEWQNPKHQTLMFVLEGDAIRQMDSKGQMVRGDTLCVCMNAQFEDVCFKMPFDRKTRPWCLLLTTSSHQKEQVGHLWHGGEKVVLQDHSICVFRIWRAPKRSSLTRTHNYFGTGVA
jgi:glycogen operon protein